MTEIAESAARSSSRTEVTGTERIVRSSLSEQITESLRSDIVHGRIPAGTHLVQDELCERFGTSRMPVRDALQQLTHEGILEQHGQQRVVVSIEPEDVEDVQALIAVLHGFAAGRAAELASEEELEDLVQFCQATAQEEDPYQFGRLSMEFHRKINRLAKSPTLLRTLQTFQRTVPQTMPFTLPNGLVDGKAGHRAIVEAIRARDAERAEQLTRSISIGYVSLLVESLRHQAGRQAD